MTPAIFPIRLVLFALAAPFVVRFALPETSGRALDEISPERASAPAPRESPRAAR